MCRLILYLLCLTDKILLCEVLIQLLSVPNFERCGLLITFYCYINSLYELLFV